MLKRIVVGTALLLSTPVVADPWPYGPSIGSGTTNIITTNTATATNGLNSQTLSAWLGQQSVNVLGQNVTGDGTTDDKANLLIAAGVAQSTGNILFIPTPVSSYKLNTDLMPAAGDLFARVSPGYVTSGTGLLKFDNQIPFQHPYVFSFDLLSKTYGAAWNGYSNVFQTASVVTQNGTTAAVVAVYGEGITNVPFASLNDAWGANFVCAAMVTASACFGVEIDVVAEATGTASKGLSINGVGPFQPNQALYITANNSTSAWQVGIVFSGASNNNPVTGALIGSTFGGGSTVVVKPTKFFDFITAQASSAELDFPSFQIGASAISPLTRLQVLAGTTATGSPGNAAKLQIISASGAGTTNGDMSLSALGNGAVWLRNSAGGTLANFSGPASGSIANDFGATSVIAGGTVKFGCVGIDSAIPCQISTIGTAPFLFVNGSGQLFGLIDPGGTVASYLQIGGATGTNDVVATVISSGTNINLDFAAHGAGSVVLKDTNGISFIARSPSASTVSWFDAQGAPASSAIRLGVGGTATNLAIDAGASNFIQFSGAGSWTANATTVVTLTALGPAGASTTIKKWLTVIDNTGATDYIPVF